MKLTVRLFAALVVLAGLASAAASPRSDKFVPSKQTANAQFPVPGCGPGIPCPPDDSNLAR